MGGINAGTVRRIAGATAAVLAIFTTGFEGYSNKVYRDTGGIKTVCVGHAYTDANGAPLRLGQVYSDEQCSVLLGQDLKQAESQLLAATPVSLSEGERRAYTDFVFNMGIGTFRASSMRRLLIAGDHPGACRRLLLYDKGRVQGKLVSLGGLARRRQWEMEQCLTG